MTRRPAPEESTGRPGRDPQTERETEGLRAGASAQLLTITVLLTAIAYTLLMSDLSIRAHHGLLTQMNDLGNADQAIWRAAAGDWRMTSSNDPYGELRSRFGIHINTVFLPLSQLYRWWPDPRLLLVLTSSACAAAAVGLYAVGRARLGASAWTLAAPAAFLASPMVHDANLYDFHVLTMMAAAFVWAVWAFERERPVLAYALLGLALLCKEDAPLIGVMLGLVLLLRGRSRHAIAVVAASIAYLALMTGVIVPYADQGGQPQAVASRWAWLTESPAAAVRALVQPDHLRLPLYLMASGAAAAWRGWRWLPLLLPHLALGVLSATLWMTRITGTYYWVLCAAVIGLACIDAAAPRDPASRTVRRGPLLALILATAAFSLLLSPLPHGAYAWRSNFPSDDNHRTLVRLSERIPVDDPISLQNNLGPHFAQRPDVASFPRRLATARWVLLGVRYDAGPCSGLFVRTTPRFTHGMELPELAERVRGLIRSPAWGTAAVEDGFYLFRRAAPDVVPEELALAQLEQDAATAVSRYLDATDHLSPVAAVTVGRLRWRDLLEQPLLRPGALPGDPVGLRLQLGREPAPSPSPQN